MVNAIPFAKLGIPIKLEQRLAPEAPRKVKLAMAQGLLPLPADVQMAVLYVLATQQDADIAAIARQALRDMPTDQLLKVISHTTHPKILEYLVEFREPDPRLDERIAVLRNANDRTVRMLVKRGAAKLCDQISFNHERLLTVPELLVDLHANPECSEQALGRAESFLRMHKQLPELPETRPFLVDGAVTPAAAPAAAPARPEQLDLEAEIMAALSGKQSPALLQAQEQNLAMFDLDGDGPGASDAGAADPALGLFSFDFKDDADEFSWDLTADRDTQGDDRIEERRSLEQTVGELTVGKKIKLAYLGNKEVRGILIRDPNKVVAGAVVRSGRLTDQEVAAFAGNKNLDNEVLREIATNGEWLRKYPVKVALVNNPKTPASVAVGIVTSLQKKDLFALTRNRNVPSVITQAAQRLYKQKFRK